MRGWAREADYPGDMWIRVLTGMAADQEVVLDTERPLVLGREQGCDLVLRDPRASRRHAELRLLAGGRVLLRDLDSANGTWVAGERVAEAVLSGGEALRAGDVALTLVADAPATRPPAPARGPAGGAAPPGGAAPTYSMVGRLLDSRARRTNGIAAVAAGLATVAAVGVAILLLARGDAAAEMAGGVPEVIARVGPSTVRVETLRRGESSGSGSGWVYEASAGLVATNAHVVNQGDRLRVVAQGRSRSARVVGVAPCQDIALLRVEDRTGLRSARLAPAAAVQQGEAVVALGFRAGAGPNDEPAATTGVVSDADADYGEGAADVPAYVGAVQTDTALNPGSSGGPLVDLTGSIVGMNAAVRGTGPDGRSRQNENYAIAAHRLRSVLDALRRGRPAGWTGLTFDYPSAAQLAARRLPAGLLVTGATQGSPAAGAGLAGTRGTLVAVDGRAVGTTLRSYCAAVAGSDPGWLSFADAGTGLIRRVRL